MALIKCNECGHEISDKASFCPNCGCPIEDLLMCDEKVSVCSECGADIPSNVAECPNCGYPIKEIETYQEELYKTGMSKRGKKWAVVLICLVIGLIVGVGYSVFSSKISNEVAPEKTEEKKDNKPQMDIVLYNDDTGEIRDGNGNRIAGFHIYGRSGSINMYLSTNINFFGVTTDKIILHKGKAYSNSNDYIYNENTTGVPYTQKEEGTEIHYLFYNANSGEIVAVEKTIEQKIREAKTKEEVRQLIDGTTWHYTENLSTSRIGCWLKVEFNNGRYTSYYAQPSDGHWTMSKTGTYKIEEGRYSNTGGKYIAVGWDGDLFAEFMTVPCEFQMTTDSFELHLFSSFMDSMNNLQHGHYYNAKHGRTHYTGQMEFGDYSW